MDKLSRQIKTLEVNQHNLIVRQNELNAKQDVFNQQVASNMLALGSKVFPEKFKKETKAKIKEIKVEGAKITTLQDQIKKG